MPSPSVRTSVRNIFTIWKINCINENPCFALKWHQSWSTWILPVSYWFKLEKSKKSIFSVISVWKKGWNFLCTIQLMYRVCFISGLLHMFTRKKQSKEVVLTTVKKIHIREVGTYFNNLGFTWWHVEKTIIKIRMCVKIINTWIPHLLHTTHFWYAQSQKVGNPAI